MGKRNLLFESIFNRKFSDEEVRSFLAQVTKEHPYFSPAQYFLLLQTDKNSKAYAQQLAKTSVLFNNPHWLKFQLDEYEREPAELSNSMVTNDNEVVFAETPATPPSQFEAPLETITEDEFYRDSSFEKDAELEPLENPEIRKDDIELVSDEEVEVVPTTDNTENIVVEELAQPAFQDVNNDTTEPITEDIIEATSTPDIPENLATEEFENEVNVSEIRPTEEVIAIVPEIIPVKDENETQMEGDNIVDEETTPEIKETTHSGHFNNDDSPLVNESETEEELANEKEDIEPLNFKLSIDTSGTTEDTISFEPLHATDYFASLGIKLSGEIQPNDKLGKQLKSFTEWLKTMKKIHADQQSHQSGPAEITVQKLAENSNKQQEIVTESMADVLIQQGKSKKAIEVYKKLSLLDSSKSAYFAAKIDQLKEH